MGGGKKFQIRNRGTGLRSVSGPWATPIPSRKFRQNPFITYWNPDGNRDPETLDLDRDTNRHRNQIQIDCSFASLTLTPSENFNKIRSEILC